MYMTVIFNQKCLNFCLTAILRKFLDMFGIKILPGMFFKLSYLSCISSLKSVTDSARLGLLLVHTQSRTHNACVESPPKSVFLFTTCQVLHPDRLLTLTPYYCSAEGDKKSLEGVEVVIFDFSKQVF